MCSASIPSGWSGKGPDIDKKHRDPHGALPHVRRCLKTVQPPATLSEIHFYRTLSRKPIGFLGLLTRKIFIVVTHGSLRRQCRILELVIPMIKNMSIVLYVVVLAAVVVSIDLLFFKNHLWERLIANIGIVLIFAAFYLRFFPKKP
ncbi:MAG: hypothetical protein C7B43_13425 [Sulfobacillus benefaciens]|uniref:Uncharacterized protein n=1 Tax=Sulfobacillus benefaciens TaxID=453960 RepID=A0A2T2WWJ7_9FIRM|nr:MAG: hypothetical protein C7B43_13425 [Sulfobacillus benefaciens]HBQ93940.1 hypothetical protein [Sulfobacillus sp.]